MQDAPGYFFFHTYRFLTGCSASLLSSLLDRRLIKGKEVADRVREKRGEITVTRPGGPLVWIHAASVGEVQSALILIQRLGAAYPALNILVTTGTVTSARIVEGKLPPGAVHQFCPLDHPRWAEAFLNHWRPDLVFWMESELWPNMLEGLRARNVPAVLVNARLSPRSFRAWLWAKPLAARMLRGFALVLAQTDEDAVRLRSLGFSGRVAVTDNLKYSALPLSYDPQVLEKLKSATAGRAVWVFASTHKGEEAMAARVHSALKNRISGLLTIVVPRHPERRTDIAETLRDCGLGVRFRGVQADLPHPEDDLYIADTLGELGLFYRLCPVACIGRSFSDDGGGGHNPLEAAQLGCAVLHGPNIQNLQQIFDDMGRAGAALRLSDETALIETLAGFFESADSLQAQRSKGQAFAAKKSGVIDRVMHEIEPLLREHLPEDKPDRTVRV